MRSLGKRVASESTAFSWSASRTINRGESYTDELLAKLIFDFQPVRSVANVLRLNPIECDVGVEPENFSRVNGRPQEFGGEAPNQRFCARRSSAGSRQCS